MYIYINGDIIYFRISYILLGNVSKRFFSYSVHPPILTSEMNRESLEKRAAWLDEVQPVWKFLWKQSICMQCAGFYYQQNVNHSFFICTRYCTIYQMLHYLWWHIKKRRLIRIPIRCLTDLCILKDKFV